MSITIEKTRYECASLPKRFHRDEILKRSSVSIGTGSSSSTSNAAVAGGGGGGGVGASTGKVDLMYYNRGVRNDASLVPPIRQTASIFKQPVTIYRGQESKVKTDFKHGVQEKPKQLMWEKRLEGLRACDLDGMEFKAMELPKGLKSVGPNISEETIIQSVATALHVSTQPVTGQTRSKASLDKNLGAFLDPRQPLVQCLNVQDDDIRRQEDRVVTARKRLREALKEN